MPLTPSRFILLMLLMFSIEAQAQSLDNTFYSPLPKEVRGYRVHRAQVDLKKTSNSRKTGDKDEYDEAEPLLIRLGEPALVGVSPLGITFDIPVILSAVTQQGEVDRLVFEDMQVNETGVVIDDYAYKFKLPNKHPLVLNPSIRIFVSTPQALFRTIDEIFNSREIWPITGRIYVCGQFKKFLMKFKRAVPVEINTSIRNPLR